MDDNTFYTRVWTLATIVVALLIGSCTAGSFDRRDKWEKAVANGADPMVVSCALYELSQAEQVICALLAQNRK